MLFSRFADVPLLIFWTRNGELTGLRVEGVDTIPMRSLTAAIGLGSPGAAVDLNFGEDTAARPFLFGLADLDFWGTETPEVSAGAGEGVATPDSHQQPGTRLGAVDDRLWRFRCVGNAIGLCLLHGGEQYELRLPLYFSRHVYKFLLGRRSVVAYSCKPCGQFLLQL